MTTLLEAKLNSLPEKFTSGYPPLVQTNLDAPFKEDKEVEAQFTEVVDTGNTGSEVPISPDIDPPKQEEEKESLSPEDALENFLQENEDYRGLYKMLKIGITKNQVEQNVKMKGLDMDIYNELLKFAEKVLPNIH